MRLLRIVIAVAALAGAGCGNSNCKQACDKITACGLKSSGFSCDSNCAKPDDACAVCLNDKSCDEIASGKCGGDCPNASFTK